MGKITRPFDPELFDAMQGIEMKVSVYFLPPNGKKKRYIQIKNHIKAYLKLILYDGHYREAYVFPSYNVLSRRYTDIVTALLDLNGEIDSCYLINGEFRKMPEVHGDLFMSWNPISLSVNDNLNQNTLL